MLFYIILAILAFGLIIAIHELGHFAAAKLLGVRVNEFAIGMGPAILKKQMGETLYSLRAVPMGGFCAMEGEDEDTDSPESFLKKPAWKKIVILTAGSFLNFVAGFLLVLALTIQSGTPTEPVIGSFPEGFPYEGQQGFLLHDRIVSMDGRRVYGVNDVKMYLSLAKGAPIDFALERGGQMVALDDFTIVPKEYPNEKGEMELRYGLDFTALPPTAGNLIQQGWEDTLFYARSVWVGLGMLVSGDAGMNDLAGPVGIVSMIGETGTAAESEKGLGVALSAVCSLVALIAVNLAVVNMLPLPALDGGRIFLILLNSAVFFVTKRRIPQKYEAYIHGVGFMLLIGLMLLVTFHDVIKLVR